MMDGSRLCVPEAWQWLRLARLDRSCPRPPSFSFLSEEMVVAERQGYAHELSILWWLRIVKSSAVSEGGRYLSSSDFIGASCFAIYDLTQRLFSLYGRNSGFSRLMRKNAFPIWSNRAVLHWLTVSSSVLIKYVY